MALPHDHAQGKRKKRGRPSNASQDESTRTRQPHARETKPSASGKRGRPKKSIRRTGEQASQLDSQPKKSRLNGRNGTAENEEQDELSQIEPGGEQYLQLRPAKKRITQEAMKSWPEITQPILHQITRVLNDAKIETVCSRRDGRRQDEADEVLHRVIRRIEHRLSTARVPPHAKDDHFNLNRLTELNNRMHRQVTAGRHSVQLLDERVRGARNTLVVEEQKRDELQHHVDRWQIEWRRREKQAKHHPLLDDESEVGGDGPEDIALKTSTLPEMNGLDMTGSDTDLAVLLEQLRRSLETMQGNHAQVDGIDEAMTAAQVALDDMLFKHASVRQYDAL